MVKYQFTSQDCENENNINEEFLKLKEAYLAQQAQLALLQEENLKLKEQVEQLSHENQKLNLRNLFNGQKQQVSQSLPIKADEPTQSLLDIQNDEKKEQQQNEDEGLLLFGDPTYNAGSKIVPQQLELKEALDFQDVFLGSQKEEDTSKEQINSNDEDSETQHIH